MRYAFLYFTFTIALIVIEIEEMGFKNGWLGTHKDIWDENNILEPYTKGQSSV